MIFIVTVYKPYKNHLGSGPFTVYNQQWTMMRHNNIKQPEPRKQFDADLLQFIQKLQANSHRLIIVGDFNETHHKSKVLQESNNMGLVDTVMSRHYNTLPF